MNKLYLKSALWDLVLVFLAAMSLCYMLLNGFYVDPALQYSPLPAVIVAVCLLALFFIGSNKRYMVPGGIVFAVVVVVAWLASGALTPTDVLLVDNETNYLIFTMVCTLVPIGCYLLSRSRASALVLFAIGAFLMALMQMFYGRFELVWAIIMVVSMLALVIYKNYQSVLRSATSVEKISFVPGFAVAVCATVVAVGIGLGLWFGVISQLNPGAVEIKLITEYRALETIEVRGLSDEYQIPNLDTTSDQTGNESRTTDDIKESLDGEHVPATGDATSDPDDGQSEGLFMGLNLESIQDAFDMQSHPQNWPLLLILIIPIALIVAYFVLRRAWRTRRLNQMRALGPEGEFEQLFLYLIGKFERVGVRVPEGQTMLEFGTSSEAAMYYYNKQSGIEFKDLATSYATMVYGVTPVSDEDVSKMESFYTGFWKAARKQLGNVKYFFTSFRLH